MIDLKKLPEPVFFAVDQQAQYAELVAKYEEIAGVQLSPAQVEAILLATFSYRENVIRIAADDAAKQTLLAFARGAVLEHIAARDGIVRLSATPSKATLRFTFSVALPAEMLIPAGTRASSSDGDAVFATDADVTAGAGALDIEIAATCTEAGEAGNGYEAGQIGRLVDPLPYVSSVENTDITSGGADDESDDRLRMRVQLVPESYSTAGPEGGYEFWARSAHQDIVDVAVTSPAAGEVVIYPLLKGGALPDANMLALVTDAVSSKKRRPLTDHVTVAAPTVVDYTIDVSLYLYKSVPPPYDDILSQAQDALDAYADLLKNSLGTDIVPEQIVGLLQQIPGVYRAVVTQPALVELAENEVAICTGEPAVAIAGSVDG